MTIEELKARRAELDHQRADLNRQWRTHDRVLVALLPAMCGVALGTCLFMWIVKKLEEAL